MMDKPLCGCGKFIFREDMVVFPSFLDLMVVDPFWGLTTKINQLHKAFFCESKVNLCNFLKYRILCCDEAVGEVTLIRCDKLKHANIARTEYCLFSITSQDKNLNLCGKRPPPRI